MYLLIMGEPCFMSLSDSCENSIFAEYQYNCFRLYVTQYPELLYALDHVFKFEVHTFSRYSFFVILHTLLAMMFYLL
jgi:hypothetical protein